MSHMTSDSSNPDFVRHVGLAHKILKAHSQAGFTATGINRLAENPDLLGGLHNVFCGLAEIKAIEHVINCDACPQLPGSSRVLEEEQLPNRVCGQFVWHPKNVQLYLSPSQTGDKKIKGKKLRKELENKRVLNACVLDYLLAKPILIPEEWKGNLVIFWGTIFHYFHLDGNLCVHFLWWYNNRWDSGCLSLKSTEFLANYPSAVLAS